MYITKAETGIIGIEENKPHSIEAMKNACASENNISVSVVKTKYPQGAEKQLIYATLKRKVPNGGLPLDVGVVVQNVATARAVYQAIVLGKPLVERPVTVSGESVKKPSNFVVRIGDTYEKCILAAGGLRDDVAKIISGGPMMGFALFTVDNLPVTKGTSGVLALNKSTVRPYSELPCISCSGCVDICPMNLLPTTLTQRIKAKQYSGASEINVMACIECGSCAFVCPSKIPLVQYIKIGKNEARKIMAAEKQKEDKK